MKKLTLIFNIVSMFTILLGTLPMQGMKRSCKERQLAQQATIYNVDDCVLIRQPDEILNNIFSHALIQDECQDDRPEKEQIAEFASNIETCMQLKNVCKRFDNFLTQGKIDELCCKNYSQNKKNNILDELLIKVIIGGYASNRLPALIMTCAGGISRYGSLLFERALRRNDVRLISTLLKYNIGPISLVGVHTVEMAQVFIDNGVNIHETDIIWHIIDSDYSIELFEFYLKQNADVKKLGRDNACLLHKLASVDAIPDITWALNIRNRYNCYTLDDNLLKKGEFLLAVIADMINTLDNHGRTPIDVAQQSLKIVKEFGNTKAMLVLKQLIELFRNHDGLTAQETAPKVVYKQKPLDKKYRNIGISFSRKKLHRKK